MTNRFYRKGQQKEDMKIDRYYTDWSVKIHYSIDGKEVTKQRYDDFSKKLDDHTLHVTPEWGRCKKCGKIGHLNYKGICWDCIDSKKKEK